MSTPLGEFLRARRDSTSPQSLGLPAGVRRRAPGIRRSELATLAGVSVEYLTRIEQGRDRNPSPQIVRALADALDLDAGEREHIRHLTKITAGACTAAGPTIPRQHVRPAVQAMVRQFEPGIAFVTNRIGEIMTSTSGFELLAGPSGVLDGDRPNLVRYVFVDERAHSVFPDWGSFADELAFDLWTGHSPAFTEALTAEAGDELARRLNGNKVPARRELRWMHPEVGLLNLNREVLELPAADDQQLVVLLPADEATSDAVQRLRTTSTHPLRAVN